jgi:transcription-repair coupling factor (superfamily II helicase)
MEIINEVEKAAEKDIWSLMQFTENLRRQYGKEPYSMEILLKKLYVRRMAADLGISRIYASGKMVRMKTNMSKNVFKLILDSMVSDVQRNSLDFEGDQIKVYIFFILLLVFGIVIGGSSINLCSFFFQALNPQSRNNFQCS